MWLCHVPEQAARARDTDRVDVRANRWPVIAHTDAAEERERVTGGTDSMARLIQCN
jgi:hypothetical protein